MKTFAQFVSPISAAHSQAVHDKAPAGVVASLAAAVNLAIRFSMPGQSRSPRHEMQAIFCCLSCAFEALESFDERGESAKFATLRTTILALCLAADIPEAGEA